MNKNKKDSVVKIDSDLLNEIEEYINKKENQYKYVNKKQFIDIAVLDYLKRKKRKQKK